jgi:hypothetical protein
MEMKKTKDFKKKRKDEEIIIKNTLQMKMLKYHTMQ